ncbi:23S rRNA (adenine(1618)-N(6))-methyltransferase RlmF [Candidatus Cetobacterium colombiensis]|uniref:23S rRNA (Adenine(1618)-N(6))-methyltransferase RlmF n=1 Tax=Candidatus Cetobacterium colombiensis TaxID=3073100 RepID=A0ABU4W816_9FUSO|nr:23S rRNA (adenine(1618)-N(6))-methyltransferase RlmF [Candidatus Cetobacterium colombiensis]MDX8335658.1 23S rRNA (adenine(1618)-N(6))-methyltransferase RlmF [Candidatus Cetobacterium colombiensis]
MKKEIKKGELHPNNPHKGKYDFSILSEKLPELHSFIKKNPIGEDTIDFSDNEAIICLNKALIKTYYNIDNWDIPTGFLCPPIPGRADYIHYIAELLSKKENINVLDIGTGANCIYPIIGSQTYGWNFTASDIDPKSIENAQKIIDTNPSLKDKVKLKLQEDKNHIFTGVIDSSDKFDLTMCNPPFHSSLEEALKANKRKVDNLNKGNKNIKKGLNFGGQKAELWCPGGERLFLKKMAKESVLFAKQVFYFTSLVSNKDNIKPTIKILEKLGAKCQLLEMSQGQKVSRVLAWTFKK